MVDATISRARPRDLACLGRSRPPDAGGAGLQRASASRRRAATDAAGIAGVPSTSPRAASSGPETSDLRAINHLDRVEAGEAVQEQAPPVSGDGDEGAVMEAEHPPPGARVQGVDAVLAVADVDDSVDDRGRAGDRPRGRVPPA